MKTSVENKKKEKLARFARKFMRGKKPNFGVLQEIRSIYSVKNRIIFCKIIAPSSLCQR